MRVTNSMVVRSTLRDLNLSLSRLQDSQADLSTGRVIRKVSDDPTRAAEAMSVRNQLRRADQRSRSLDDAEGWLQAADTSLLSGLDLMSRVKELTVRASNAGVSDPTVRGALAAEVTNIREELIALANTQTQGRSIFNGTAAGKAYDPATGNYLGNAALVNRDVAPGTTVTANLTGEQVFGSQGGPTGDLFAVLDRLSAAISTGDTATVEVEHANLDVAATRLASAAGEIGSRAARLDSVRERAASDDVRLREALSQLEDTDIAEALIGVKSNENAYTAALQAAARVIPPSLLDYLR